MGKIGAEGNEVFGRRVGVESVVDAVCHFRKWDELRVFNLMALSLHLPLVHLVAE